MKSVPSMGRVHTLATEISAGCLFAASASAVVVSDFNGSGFNYTWEGFSQQIGPTQVRLSDPNNGWGGATIQYSNPLDYSGLTSQHLQIDYTVQPGHGAPSLTLEFYDTANRSVKFSVPTPKANAGVARTYTTRNVFAEPTSGVNDFQNFNYAQINRLNVLGDFLSDQPFNVSIDRIQFTPDAPEAYAGRSPDASWRTEAQQRIDQVRKGDLQIVLTRNDGTPIQNAQVRVLQQQHAFGFGSAAVASQFVGNPNANETLYRQKVRALFNIVTPENTLKWPALEGEFGNNFSRQIAIDTLQWLEDNDIRARGHNLVWPGEEHLPDSIVALYNNLPALRQAVRDHVTDIAGLTQNKVEAWDVVNEPRDHRDLMDFFGDTVMDEWFNLAEAVNDAKLYLNDFNIITGNEIYEDNQDLYLSQIQGLQQRGAPIGGIGMQGHFSANALTDMEQVWTILDKFHDATGLPISITEYDIRDTPDEQLKADYLRDFLTAVFAHEGTEAFVLWGFWETTMSRPESALLDANWNLTAMGQAWVDLIFDQWWTDEALATDALGSASLRAFRGRHQVEVTVEGETRTYNVEVDEVGFVLSDVFDITTATLAGDFNGNGMVEQSDLDLVLGAWGQSRGSWSNVHGLTTSAVDQEELDRVLSNWGSTSLGSLNSSTLPEPGVAAVLSLLTLTRRTRATASQGA